MKLTKTFSLTASIIRAQEAAQCDTSTFCTFPAIGMLDETYLMNESMCNKQGCCFHPVQKNVGGKYIGFCYANEQQETTSDSGILDLNDVAEIFDDLTGSDDLPPIELTLKIADINKNMKPEVLHDTTDPNLETLRRFAPLTNPFADLASTQQDMLRKTHILATQLSDSSSISPAVPSMEEILEEIRRNAENEKLAQGILSILSKNDDESINADKVNRIRNKYGDIITLNGRQNDNLSKTEKVEDNPIEDTMDSTTEQLQALIRKQSDDLNNQLKLFEMILEVLIKNNTFTETDPNHFDKPVKQVDLMNPSTVVEIHSEGSQKTSESINFSPEITYENQHGLQIAKETGYNIEFTSMNKAFSQGLEETCSAYRSMSMCCKNSDSPFCDFVGNNNNFKNYWTVYTGITDTRILKLQMQSIDNMAGTWDTSNYEPNYNDVYANSASNFYSSVGRPSINSYQQNYNKLQPRAVSNNKKGKKYRSKFTGMSKIHRIGRRAVADVREEQHEPIGQLSMGSIITDEEIDQLDTFNATESDISHQEELEQRIVGGSEAMGTDLKKHMAYMYLSYSNLPFCGGTLINDQWIITAAHCVTTYCSKESSLDEVRVMLGKYYRDAWKPNDGMDFGVSHIICHRENCKASGEPRLHDMALIKLDRKVHNHKHQEIISPAKLPSSYDEPILSKDCITLGWGATTTNGYGSEEHLKMAVMPVYSNYQCNQPDWRSCTIRSGMICAGSADDRPCKGDSGGPLFCPYRGDENHYVLQGVYSYGRCNRVLKKPAVYTRVSHYLEWIQDTVREN